MGDHSRGGGRNRRTPSNTMQLRDPDSESREVPSRPWMGSHQQEHSCEEGDVAVANASLGAGYWRAGALEEASLLDGSADWKVICEESTEAVEESEEGEESAGEGNSGTVASEEDYECDASRTDSAYASDQDEEEGAACGFAWMVQLRLRKYYQTAEDEDEEGEESLEDIELPGVGSLARDQILSAHSLLLTWNRLRRNLISQSFVRPEEGQLKEAESFLEEVIPFAAEVKDYMGPEEWTLQDALCMKHVLTILEDYHYHIGSPLYQEYVFEVLPAWILFYRSFPNDLVLRADAISIALSEATEGAVRSPDQCMMRFFQSRKESLSFYEHRHTQMLSIVEGITESMYLH